jgi:NAD(P)H-dependent flavin oxidoreductase YrpB (nitropropane dioxygenase family)
VFTNAVSLALGLKIPGMTIRYTLDGTEPTDQSALYTSPIAITNTVMVRAISGRPARCLANRFTRLAEGVPDAAIPDYPITYDLGKALNAAAKAKGESGFGAQWAGQGAPLSRPLPAAELVRVLVKELQAG